MRKRDLKVCKHCGSEFALGVVGRRPRGLCSRCYKRPEVVAAYPPLPGSYCGVAAAGGRVPKEPTHHLPGTPGKMEVMRRRVERGESCFHESDGMFGPHGEGE